MHFILCDFMTFLPLLLESETTQNLLVLRLNAMTLLYSNVVLQKTQLKSIEN